MKLKVQNLSGINALMQLQLVLLVTNPNAEHICCNTYVEEKEITRYYSHINFQHYEVNTDNYITVRVFQATDNVIYKYYSLDLSPLSQ